MLLGLAAGKVGDLVFYRDGGEQRTRTRVVPKNPRSPLQMAQRVRMANVSAVYRSLAPVVRDSFSNRPSNQSGYNAFASGAIELSPFMTKEMANADSVLPMPAVISKGAMSPAPIDFIYSPTSAAVYLAIGAAAESTSTVAAVSAAIIAADSSYQYGDTLTFVGLQFALSELAGEVDVYNAIPTIKSLTLDASDTRTLEAAGFTVNDEEVGIVIPDAGTDGDFLAAAAIVHSRVDEQGALQTSFARLELNTSALTLYNTHRTNAALQAAIESYNAGTESILR